jgi:chromosomal replication initiation ATPase DnaA
MLPYPFSGTQPYNLAEKPITSNRIIMEVSREFNLSRFEILGLGEIKGVRGRRKENIFEARAAAIYYMRTQLKMQLKEIGKVFGITYSSVINALYRINDLMDAYADYRQKVANVYINLNVCNATP